MTKDNVLETVGTVGKLALRGAVYVGTNVGIIGGGLFYSLLLAGKVKNVIAQTAIIGAGVVCSSIAAASVGEMVDDYLVEEYDLDV